MRDHPCRSVIEAGFFAQPDRVCGLGEVIIESGGAGGRLVVFLAPAAERNEDHRPGGAAILRASSKPSITGMPRNR